MGFHFVCHDYRMSDLAKANGWLPDYSIKFACIVGSCKAGMKSEQQAACYVDHDSDEETVEDRRRRYIDHINRHDRRMRNCPVGCKAHLVNPDTVSRYAQSDTCHRKDVHDMTVEELEAEVE